MVGVVIQTFTQVLRHTCTYAHLLVTCAAPHLVPCQDTAVCQGLQPANNTARTHVLHTLAGNMCDVEQHTVWHEGAQR